MTYEKDLQATLQDRSLLENLHPMSTRLLNWAGQERVRKIPGVGVVITDGELIRSVMTTKALYSKQGRGVSSSFWNPIIGNTGLLNMDGAPHLKLRRTLASTFSPKNVEKFIVPEMSLILEAMVDRLLSGKNVDLVSTVSEFVYKALWKFAGFSENIIAKHYTSETIDDLRSATHGVNIAKKKLSIKQIRRARARLKFVDLISVEAYSSSTEIPEGTVLRAMIDDGYSLEEISSLMKAFMIAGTETVISFIPRMIAILIDSERFYSLSDEELDLAVDECLRITVPTAVAVRSVKQDTVLGGKDISRGSRVVLNIVGACQKEGIFRSDLPPISKEVKGLWFGAGVHMCVGLPVAMLEAKTVLKELVKLNNVGKLVIVGRKASSEGHTGSYETLTLKLERENDD